MTDLDLGYLAGILDGEGCFRMKSNQYGYSYPYVTVKMTDLDVLQRCQKITGLGRIEPCKSKVPDHYKKQWIWDIRKQHEAVSLMNMILPLMSERRKEKIEEILLQYKERG